MKLFFSSAGSRLATSGDAVQAGTGPARKRSDDGDTSQGDLVQIYRSHPKRQRGPIHIGVLETSLGTGRVKRSAEDIVLSTNESSEAS